MSNAPVQVGTGEASNIADLESARSPLQALLDKQRAAYKESPYPDLKTRLDRIDRVMDMARQGESQLVEALTEDFGNRHPSMSRVTDLMPVVAHLKWCRKQVAGFMKGQSRKTNFPFNIAGGKSRVEHLPLGVVGNISPWNFPVNLSLVPMGAIFGAGNRCMLKPSELTPATAQVMAELVAANFDESEFAVVTGGPEVAAEFSSLRFDHLLFTGSTAIAKHVAVAAAKNLVPVTLELGGKNPVVIGRSANVSLMAKRVMLGNTINAGQICLAPDTVYVPEGMEDEVREALLTEARAMFKGSDDEAYTEMLSERYAERMRAMANEVSEQGGEVVRAFDDKGKAIAPTLLYGAKPDTAASREEIFGPLLTMRSYSDASALARELREGERPLAIYYFGSDKREMEMYTREVNSGGMSINEVILHINQDALPFGGVGHSGTGAYHGIEGFHTFSHRKAVFKQSNFDVTSVMRPPYGKLVDVFIKSEMK